MGIFVYSYRKDEEEYFTKFSKKYNVEIKFCKDAPDMDNADLARGFECISVISSPIPGEVIEKLNNAGVKFISTRTIGYDHIDMQKVKELGMRAGNVTYSPESVADYAIMLMLMTLRKIKLIMGRSSVQDYSLKGFQGREIGNMTVGVIGTGKIGRTLIRHLSGFGCRFMAHDLYENDEVKKYAQYVPLEELFKNSDIITLHAPAAENNHHMINRESICLMKKNVIIINTARGSLVDTNALIDGIRQKKIGGAALDVIEGEENIYYSDLKGEIVDNRALAVLQSMPNVIVTPHTAFYTDQAVSDMVEHSILSCIFFMEGKENPWEISR
ncbi:MAG: D-isomer specific 2-hydroxyacid dehydrogenase family protein [Clostridium sp.]|jgi:D-lactate dehydrogenase|uniref:D-isomer specific 2-hydroxyacid dehydrogenase family protein n=1 Tax=Clostridium sp. TaxID=1506 RepID=UPI0025C0F397|nr:D-isomer specific 2-hydroxyacid dehydrogenase family protein [Clostridium sp.]MCH3963632.1 D-isomer specific 2-hydroxyacid dehydrogenase family protein [Clostridium sp.]MCI1714773.1 D-isomer specific 2-hydroxyacid dehydrogenase family protein [Clostridium sp.]MCI1799038.1 D-isomer specific 2-hydroxyacid dehydrogenase family protein [Clostridium sp.]MCI1812956.1 D-isomer specific 2-hydroxyacid dehydrogenase family protein [Clostridium sp.]MCI1869846.1 D-isomer specific 2-hydroxyacid dehydrog